MDKNVLLRVHKGEPVPVDFLLYWNWPLTDPAHTTIATAYAQNKLREMNSKGLKVPAELFPSWALCDHNGRAKQETLFLLPRDVAARYTELEFTKYGEVSP